jgi:hypothetical protein
MSVRLCHRGTHLNSGPIPARRRAADPPGSGSESKARARARANLTVAGKEARGGGYLQVAHGPRADSGRGPGSVGARAWGRVLVGDSEGEGCQCRSSWHHRGLRAGPGK